MNQAPVSGGQNAENASQASVFADPVSFVAQDGGATVDRMVETMGSINAAAAAQRISDIVGIIEGIAFQTESNIERKRVDD